jgi:hypothetical protein
MQLELLYQELTHLLQPAMPPRWYSTDHRLLLTVHQSSLLYCSFAVLAITEQPLPMVITKGKPLEDPVVVKLLTGTLEP